MKPKYRFYEVVKVATEFKYREVAGLQGVILGMSQNGQDMWGYAVSIDELDETWDILETDLEFTGIIHTRDDYYDKLVMKVLVDPITGEGEIKSIT